MTELAHFIVAAIPLVASALILTVLGLRSEFIRIVLDAVLSTEKEPA